MKKALSIMASIIAICIGYVLVSAMLMEKNFRIEQSVTINASPKVIFSKISNLKKWNKWSPWYKRDPKMKLRFQGPSEGVGSKYSWASKDSGSGSLTVTEFEAGKSMLYTMEFIDWESTSEGGFTLKPERIGQRLTWHMTGDNTFTERIFWVMFGMKGAIQNDFTEGLNSIKFLSENPRS